MKKGEIIKITGVIPDILKNLLDYFKDNFEKNAQEIIGSANGTIGIFVKLFAQPLIDYYFKKISKNKLKDFGFQTYLNAAFKQAEISLQEIIETVDNKFNDKLFIFAINESLLEQKKTFNERDYLLIFQPLYHPAITFVKINYISILKKLNTPINQINIFQRNFNENIESKIIEEFGSNYEKHLDETHEFRYKLNEVELLWDIIQSSKIGFSENENLKYMPTLATWKRVDRLNIDDDIKEEALQSIESLIDEYFNIEKDNHLKKILFIVADFGKGKSVFLKQYAAKLAYDYITLGEGYFPVYFNLRNFNKYKSDSRLGIIDDYLTTEYKIKIEEDYFKKKRYIFLIDSLDESGELSKSNIDKVIYSIKNIQQIKDNHLYCLNRIIITSRPIENLQFQLLNHYPYVIQDEHNRDIEHYISPYGFTSQQFNEWIFSNLDLIPNGLDKLKVLNLLNEQKDVHNALIDKNTLSKNELRRPIFAYMIYKLIINDFDFLKVGKIGVYLSFINYLTKTAKHIDDTSYKVNLLEEFEYRNILHSTAAIWLYERHKGNHGYINKADICRFIEGENKKETDDEILNRFRTVKEIQFLSNSYFGMNGDTLYFQHQSFAEILLAEYYLKIFIKYALDEGDNIEEARIKLVIGEPTKQTIQFLSEILQLLKETSSNCPNFLDKRKLLYPLFVSIAYKKNNRIFCNEIHYEWFKKNRIFENISNFSDSAINNWCITDEQIDKIIDLTVKMINSSTVYLPTKIQRKTSLFDNEIISIQNTHISSIPPDIDKWIALLVGTKLYNSNKNKYLSDKKVYFEQVSEMMINWNHYSNNYFTNSICPNWSDDWLVGINIVNTHDSYRSKILLNLSHEIRVPLNGIIGFSRIIKEQEKLSDNEVEIFNSIIKSNLSKLISVLNNSYFDCFASTKSQSIKLLNLNSESMESTCRMILDNVFDEIERLKKT